jgi:hypothetical protein
VSKLNIIKNKSWDYAANTLVRMKEHPVISSVVIFAIVPGFMFRPIFMLLGYIGLTRMFLLFLAALLYVGYLYLSEIVPLPPKQNDFLDAINDDKHNDGYYE